MARAKQGQASRLTRMTAPTLSPADPWPALPLDEWRDTYATLHLWLQIAGKVRLILSPWLNHSWHATLYPTATGLTTSLIPYRSGAFEIDFDFINHRLHIRAPEGRSAGFALEPQSVATFYQRLMRTLASLGIHVGIHRTPSEIADAVPFDQDETHQSYDPEYAARLWRVIVQSHRVFSEFRVRFIGKCSPVHFFWGAPDLAVTRFSGRIAPLHPGGVVGLPDKVVRDAYSHEVSSCGFWPGGGPIPYPVFYSYAYPEPPGFPKATVQPSEAFYDSTLREFILPYDAVRESALPDAMLLAFLQTSYEAAAELGKWDRGALERDRLPHDSPVLR
jgi:hypothetical protein